MNLLVYETHQAKWTLDSLVSKNMGLGKDWILGRRKGNVWVITHSLKSCTSVLRICILIILTVQSHILHPNKASHPPYGLAGAQRHADMFPFTDSSSPFGSNPHLDRLFNPREEVCAWSWQGLEEQDPQHCSSGHHSQRCASYLQHYLCRATGDNQTPSHSIKRLLDCAKAVFEWDNEEKHREGLVLLTYSPWRRSVNAISVPQRVSLLMEKADIWWLPPCFP